MIGELEFARAAMRTEAEAIQRSASRLDDRFLRALELLDSCAGKVVTTGVGKSGIVAHKIAATLTSIGAPAVFLHPSEAMHGDLGIVRPEDVVIALSNSGESEEVLAMLPALLVRGVSLIAIVGNLDSTLARTASVVLDARVEREVCPLNLSPTTSAIVALAIGDALAVTLEKRRDLQREAYALNHPGGRLGRRLIMRVRDIMREGEMALPLVDPDGSFKDVVCEVSAKHVGATCVVGQDNLLLGIIAESELRLAFLRHDMAVGELKATDLMNPAPAVVLHPDMLAYEALQHMEDRARPVSVAPVVDGAGIVVGIVHIHDLVRARL